jgi:hypothetical protein
MEDEVKKPVNTTLSLTTIKQIDEILRAKRWNKNDVIEVAVDNLHRNVFGDPPTVQATQSSQH